MADKGPNWKAEQLKLKVGIENLKVNLIRADLEITEAEGRIEASNVNKESLRVAIAEGEKKLKDLIKDKGNLIEAEGVTKNG